MAKRAEPPNRKKKLGFIGGTFNPIHYGHTRLAEAARIQFKLDLVLFIPNHLPPHRNAGSENIVDGEKRLIMAVLATLPNPHFLVSDKELARKGISYTYDTALTLKKEYPDHSLFFIGGTDTLAHYTWHRFPELANLLDGFLLATRNTAEAEESFTHLKKVASNFASKLGKIQMEPVEVSSTEIRERIRNKKRIDDLTPLPVVQYIERYRLYREVGAS